MAKTSRKSTRFIGVQSRESSTRKHNGRADICYTIDFMDSITKKRVRKDIGWASDGMTAVYASKVRTELMHGTRGQSGALLQALNMNKKSEMSLGQAFERYVTEWLIPRGKHHAADNSMFHNHLTPWAQCELSSFDVYVIDTIIGKLTKKGLSTQSVRYTVALIRRVMRRMEAWNLYDGQIPFNKITLPKPNNRRERFLTPEEARILLDALATKSSMVHLQAMIALHCGLRFGEIAALSVGDIDFYGNNILIRDTKSGKARHAVMTASLVEFLRKWIINTEPKGLIFPNRTASVQKEISKTFERTVKELGFNMTNGSAITDARQKVVFHTLRHTYASWLAFQGQGQAVIADLLGHSSLEMSARYTHLFPDSRRKSAVEIEAIFRHE